MSCWRTEQASTCCHPDCRCDASPGAAAGCGVPRSFVVSTTAVRQLRVGGNRACVIDANADLWCWELAIGSSAGAAATLTASHIMAVDLSTESRCTLDRDGEVRCCGRVLAGSTAHGERDSGWREMPGDPIAELSR
jgi:hypothetical protein